MEIRFKLDPDFESKLFGMQKILFKRVWSVVQTIINNGRILPSTAAKFQLRVHTISSDKIPTVEIVQIEIGKTDGRTLNVVYLTEMAEIRVAVVYFVLLGLSDEITLEFARTEGYTRYERLKNEPKGVRNDQ